MNNIYFCIASDELGREIAWQWKDQNKQFFKTWIPSGETDIQIIDEVTPDEKALVIAEIMHEIQPELKDIRLQRNKQAKERRNAKTK
tara:strand:+ start:527 stop:787 length:261 start_codon:yes stop_codon:yes gene_type:complete